MALQFALTFLVSPEDSFIIACSSSKPDKVTDEPAEEEPSAELETETETDTEEESE